MTDDERSKRRVSRHRKPAFRIFRTVTAREKPEPQAVTRIELANEFIDKSKSVTFANLGPSHCRWGYGDPKRPGFVFCGCEKVTGDPYCEPHMAIAVQPSTKRSAAA
jgi:GcrA cell cycle regulator